MLNPTSVPQALSWTFFHLMSQPDLVKPLRAEVDQVGVVDYDSFKTLKETLAVFNEVRSCLLPAGFMLTSECRAFVFIPRFRRTPGRLSQTIRFLVVPSSRFSLPPFNTNLANALAGW